MLWIGDLKCGYCQGEGCPDCEGTGWLKICTECKLAAGPAGFTEADNEICRDCKEKV